MAKAAKKGRGNPKAGSGSPFKQPGKGFKTKPGKTDGPDVANFHPTGHRGVGAEKPAKSAGKEIIKAAKGVSEGARVKVAKKSRGGKAINPSKAIKIPKGSFTKKSKAGR